MRRNIILIEVGVHSWKQFDDWGLWWCHFSYVTWGDKVEALRKTFD
jgi:hypothetical protein